MQQNDAIADVSGGRFTRLEREVIAGGIFASVQDLSRKLMRHIRAYSKTARPFKWKYSDVRRRILAC
jgi:hypothetical protein